MYSSFERLFRKSTFTYFLIFASYIFLSACEGIPRGDTKPVFTIKNLPVFKQDNLNVSDASQTEKQSNKILDSKEVDTEFLDPPNILNQTPSDFSITKSVEASKSDPLEKTITRDIQSNIEKTNEESSRGNNILEPNELSYTREDNENIEDIKDSMNLNIKPEYDEGEILKSEQTKNNKLASIIDIPQTKLQVPEVKKIKLKRFLNYKVTELENMLGKPNFVLSTKDMNLWQYQAGECIVDFFLKLTRNEYLVSFIDVRAKSLGDKMDIFTCESELSNALNSLILN